MLATLRKILPTSDLKFVQVIQVGKKGTKEKFFEAEAAFLRPRPINEQAEAEKCFRDSLFLNEVTEDVSNQMWTHFSKDSGKHKN